MRGGFQRRIRVYLIIANRRLLRILADALLECIPNSVINRLKQRLPLNFAIVLCTLIIRANFFALLYTAAPL